MSSCEMFRVFNLESTLAIWKISYCTADFSRCERYRRASLGHPVDPLLLPSGTLLRKSGGPPQA